MPVEIKDIKSKSISPSSNPFEQWANEKKAAAKSVSEKTKEDNYNPFEQYFKKKSGGEDAGVSLPDNQIPKESVNRIKTNDYKFTLDNFTDDTEITLPDGSAISAKKTLPFINPEYAKGLQKRIDDNTLTTTDIHELSKATGKSPEVVDAYIKKGKVFGGALENLEKEKKTTDELSITIRDFNNEYGEGQFGKEYNPEEILVSPEKTAQFLHEYEKKSKEKNAKILAKEFVQRKAEAEKLGYYDIDVTDLKVMALDRTRDELDVLKNKFDLNRQLLNDHIVNTTIIEDKKTGVPKDQTLVKIAQRTNPKGFSEYEKGIKYVDNNPISVAYDVLSGNEEDKIELLNSVKGEAELRYNDGVSKMAVNKISQGIVLGDNNMVQEGRAELEAVDNDVIYNYPALAKQEIARRVSETIARESGQLEGSETNNLKTKIFGADQKDYLRVMKDLGYLDNPKTKDLAMSMLDNPELFADASYTGGVIGSFVQPFKELGLSIGDITQFRNERDLLSDKKREELFPKELENTKADFTLLGHPFKVRTALNTTANLAGMATIAAATEGSATGLGASTSVAKSLGAYTSFGLPSYDAALKDSYNFLDNDAARTLYATMTAITNAEGGRLLDLGKIVRIPGVSENYAKMAQGLSDKTLTKTGLKELLGDTKNKYVDFAVKYGKNVTKGAAVMSYFTTANNITRLAFGDDRVAASDILPQAGTAFMDGVLGMSIMGAFGARAEMKTERNSTYKGFIYNMALNHDAAADVFKMAFEKGEYTKEEYNQKMQILNTAKAAKGALDLAQIDNNVILNENQKAVYVANKTAASVLNKQLENIPKENEAKRNELKEQIGRLDQQNKDVMGGLKFSPTLEPLYDLFEAEKKYNEALEEVNDGKGNYDKVEVAKNNYDQLINKYFTSEKFKTKETKQPEDKVNESTETKVGEGEVKVEVKEQPTVSETEGKSDVVDKASNVGGDVDAQYNERKKSIEDKLNQQLEDNKDRLDDIDEKGGTKTVRQKIYQEHTNDMVELEKWKMKEDLKKEDTPDGRIKKNSEFSSNQLTDAIPNSEVHYENKEDNGVTTITLRDKNTKKHIASIDIGTGDTIDGYAGVRIQVNGEHQGKGLSKHLYNLALTEAKKQGLKGLYTIDEMLKTPDKTIATRDNFVTRKNTDEKLKTQARKKYTNVADPNITFIENVSDKFIKKGATKLSEQSLSKQESGGKAPVTKSEGAGSSGVEGKSDVVDKASNVGGDVDFTAKSGNKVVDENGEPLELYHGTSKVFDNLDDSKTKRGLFFTSNKKTASSYANTGGDAPKIISAHIDMKNPHIIDAKGKSYDEIMVDLDKVDMATGKGVSKKMTTDEIVEALRGMRAEKIITNLYGTKTKADGIIIKNVKDALTNNLGNPTDIYIPFKNEQIKRLNQPVEQSLSKQESGGKAPVTKPEGKSDVVGELKITDKTKDILDEVSDDKIGEKKYQDFSIDFEDGARAYGKIEDGVADISGINAPKNNGEVVRGSKTYERVLSKLKESGVKTVNIKLQSNDSEAAIKKLVDNGFLTNPRNIMGSSGNEHPVTFDIGSKVNFIEKKNTGTEIEPELGDGRNPVTLSGSTEAERQVAIEQRKKETKQTPMTEARDKLLERIQKYNNLTRPQKRQAYIEANKIKLAVDFFNKEHDQKHSLTTNRDGSLELRNNPTEKRASGKPIKNTLKGNENAIVDNGKPLMERGDNTKKVFNDLLDADVLPVSRRINGEKMSEAEHEATIQDIMDGIPSQRAENYLNSLEKQIKEDNFDFGNPDKNARTTLNDALNITVEKGEPMTPDSIEKWLSNESELTPEEQTTFDNIDNLITHYEQLHESENGTPAKVQQPAGKGQESNSGKANENGQPKSESSTANKKEPIKNEEGDQPDKDISSQSKTDNNGNEKSSQEGDGKKSGEKSSQESSQKGDGQGQGQNVKPEGKAEPVSPAEPSLDNAKRLISEIKSDGYSIAPLKEAVKNNDNETLKKYLENISEQSKDPKSEKLAIEAYGKDLVEEAKKMFPPEPPKEEGKTTIPEGGENPQRSFTKQVLEKEEVLPEVKKQVAEKIEYVKQTNAMSVAEAKETIDAIGVDEAYHLVTGNSEVQPAVRAVMGQTLILKYNELAAKEKEGTPERNALVDKTVDIANYVSDKLATQPGQMIQALSLFGRLSPEGQLRAANKDAKKMAASKKSKVKSDVDELGNKLKKINEETADEVAKSPKVKKATEKTESDLKVKSKDKIKKAQENRAKIIEKYKGEKGKNLYAGVGLTKEGIEYVGELVKTYIEEGIGEIGLIVDKVLQDLKAASGKDVTEEVTKNVNEIVSSKAEESVTKNAVRGIKELESAIGKIVKEHYTVSDKERLPLIYKFTRDLGIDNEAAKQLTKEIESEFDRIATRKKQDLLTSEKKRWDRIQAGLKGSKKDNDLQSQMIKYSNLEAFDNNSLLDMIGNKLGVGQLTPEQGQRITELAKKIEAAPEGTPKRTATENLLTYRANLKGTSWGEVAQGVWYAQVLSGYATHIRNLVSTFFNTMGFFSVQAAKNPSSVPFLMLGLGKGIGRIGAVEALHTIKTGQTPIHISKIETPDVLERIKFKGGLLNPGNWFKYVGRLMKAEDVLLFQGLKEMRATQLALREANALGFKQTWYPFSKQNKIVNKKVNELLLNTKERYDNAVAQAALEGFKGLEATRRMYELMESSRPIQMTEDAYGFAAKGTFNHETEGTLGAISDAVSGFLDNSLQVGGAKPLRFLVPFTRIITNVANNTIDYSPLGLVRAGANRRGLLASEKSGKRREMTKEERQDQVVKAAMGTAAMATLYALSANGTVQVSGAGPSDIKKKMQLLETGWQPYSIKVADKWISYKLTPFVFAFGLVGSIRDHETYDKDADEQSILDRSTLVVWDGIKNIGDMTWVSSAAPLMAAMAENNPNQATSIISRTVSRTAKSLVPVIGSNFYAQAAQRIESIFDIPQKKVNGFLESLIQDVPIARNMLNDKINALGDPIVRDPDVLWSTEKSDPVWQYLSDKKGWVAPVNKNTIIVFDEDTKEDRPVTDDEYYEFSKIRGQKIKEEIKKIIQFGATVDNEKVSADDLKPAQLNKLLTSIKTQATKETKAELFAPKEKKKGSRITVNDY